MKKIAEIQKEWEDKFETFESKIKQFEGNVLELKNTKLNNLKVLDEKVENLRKEVKNNTNEREISSKMRIDYEDFKRKLEIFSKKDLLKILRI